MSGKQSVSDKLWDFTERVMFFVVPIFMLFMVALGIFAVVAFVAFLVTMFF